MAVYFRSLDELVKKIFLKFTEDLTSPKLVTASQLAQPRFALLLFST